MTRYELTLEQKGLLSSINYKGKFIYEEEGKHYINFSDIISFIGFERFVDAVESNGLEDVINPEDILDVLPEPSPSLGIGFGEERSSFISNSGRFYLYSDKRFVTDSDDNYGTGYYQFSESGGTGDDPIYEWEHIGTLLPKDTLLKNLHFLCSANNSQVKDVEIIVVERKPTSPTGYQDGFDDDGEMTNTVIKRGLFKDFVGGTFGGNMADRHGATIPLDYTLSDLSMVSIYLRPVGNLTTTRYLTSTFTFEIL